MQSHCKIMTNRWLYGTLSTKCVPRQGQHAMYRTLGLYFNPKELKQSSSLISFLKADRNWTPEKYL